LSTITIIDLNIPTITKKTPLKGKEIRVKATGLQGRVSDVLRSKSGVEHLCLVTATGQKHGFFGVDEVEFLESAEEARRS
jgi:hypothetical protein